MKRLKVVALVLGTVFSCFLGQNGWSQTPAGEIGGGGPCGAGDPACSAAIMRRLAGGTQFLGWSVFGGAEIVPNPPVGANPVVGISAQALTLNMHHFGEMNVMRVNVAWIPNFRNEAGASVQAFRVNIRTIDTTMAFFCLASDGAVRAPFTGLFDAQNCRNVSPAGIRFSGPEVQIDSHNQRVAARWAEASFALNLIGSQGSTNWFRRNLQVDLGVTVDTVFPVNYVAPVGVPSPSGTTTIPRGVLRMMARVLTPDNRTEFSGGATWRPDFTDFLHNQYVETQVQILHHLMVSNRNMLNLGFQAYYSYATHPWQSLGIMSSDTQNNSIYLGAFIAMPYSI